MSAARRNPPYEDGDEPRPIRSLVVTCHFETVSSICLFKADFLPLVFRTEASRETPMTVQHEANGSKPYHPQEHPLR